MNNRHSFLISALLGVQLIFAAGVSAAPPQPVESCYIAMTVEEQKTASGMKFLLSSYVGVEDLLGGLVAPLTGNGESYKLSTLNSAGQALGTYGVSSGRFIIGDQVNADGSFSGASAERKSSTIDLVIPYNSQIKSIRINYSGGSQTFPMDAKNITCVKSCIAAGKTGKFNKNKCCISATPVDIGGGNFRCQ